MKKKTLLTVMACLTLSTSLVGCGSNKTDISSLEDMDFSGIEEAMKDEAGVEDGEEVDGPLKDIEVINAYKSGDIYAGFDAYLSALGSPIYFGEAGGDNDAKQLLVDWQKAGIEDEVSYFQLDNTEGEYITYFKTSPESDTETVYYFNQCYGYQYYENERSAEATFETDSSFVLVKGNSGLDIYTMDIIILDKASDSYAIEYDSRLDANDYIGEGFQISIEFRDGQDHSYESDKELIDSIIDNVSIIDGSETKTLSEL